jgi:hypothetical protein
MMPRPRPVERPVQPIGPDDDFGWPRERPRRPWKFVALVAAILVAGLVGVAVIATLRGGRPATPGPGPVAGPTRTVVPTAKGAPTGVKLTDDGTSITVTWTDPTKGTVQFAVLGGPSGEQPQLRGLVEPGTTRLTVMGLNPAVEYCFVVEAFYSVTDLAQSPPVCTHRHG